MGETPFSIAFMRGHLGVARAILEISRAQYAPGEKKLERWEVEVEVDDSDGDYCSDSEEHEAPNLYSRIVDDRFTIDNIGEVCLQVKSTTTPLTLLQRTFSVSRYFEAGLQGPSNTAAAKDAQMRDATSVFSYAILADDIDLMNWLLDVGSHFASQDADLKRVEARGRFLTLPESDFKTAMRLGRTRHLAAMLSRTGAGIPLEELVKKSGVEMKEKPAYYQGLTVYGRKRTDWAAAGHGVRMERTGSEHPPLLMAAKEGSIESVEWFLSNAPLRHYTEFAEANATDLRLKQLGQAAGGFGTAIERWMGTRGARAILTQETCANIGDLGDLVLHSAVLARPSEESQRLISYLLKTTPKAIDAKCRSGHTPLHLAFSLRRQAAARLLISAGADQTTCDNAYNNLLHTLLVPISQAGRTDDKSLTGLLDLLAPEIREQLFVQRNAYAAGAATPLHHWLTSTNSAQGTYYHYRSYYNTEAAASGPSNEKEKAATLAKLLAYSRGRELGMVNGAGETPLHTAVLVRGVKLAQAMLQLQPNLLCRENATGRTPLEIARDTVVAHNVSHIPKVTRDPYSYWNAPRYTSILDRPPSPEDDAHPNPHVREDIWKLCQEVAGKHPAHRTLVSLNEANEVAKRLAETQKAGERKRRLTYVRNEGGSDGAPDGIEGEGRDEIDSWYGAAANGDSDYEDEAAGEDWKKEGVAMPELVDDE
jgi:hypothetical protein